MRYSEDIIEEVRSRNDIVDVVGMYTHLTKKGNSYWCCCPFHGEKTPSFCVTPSKQMYYCFGCHKGGNSITFVMDYENMSFTEAVKLLADRAGVNLPEAEYSAAEKAEASLHARILEVYKLAAVYFCNAMKTEKGQVALNYFKKRELKDETIRHFGLGYSYMYSDDLYKYLKSKGYEDTFLKDTGLVTFSEKGAHDKFWNRAMFPIMDERDRVIAFGGRVMGDGEPKYLNSPETKVFDKSNNLFALNYAKLSRRGYFLLCEGYMDVISLHQAGFTNAVASLGTALTERQATKISKYVKDVYLTYDSDGAGTKAAIRAIPILESKGLTVKVVNMKPYKDPDEFIKGLGAEEYQKRIDEAESSFFFEIRIMASRYNMDDPREKTSFYEDVARRLLEFTDELTRKNYEEAFVKRYNISFRSFDELLVKIAGQEGPKKRSGPAEDSAPKKEYVSRAEKKKDDTILQPQRLLLTYLSEDPALYPRLKDVISPGEFTDEIYKKAAELAFQDCESTGSINAAKLISYFHEKEEQEKIGMIFQTTLGGELTEADRLKLLSDTVKKIKLTRIKKDIDEAIANGNKEALKKLMSDEAELKRTKNIL